MKRTLAEQRRSELKQITLTDEQIERRLNMLEKMIAAETDWKNLPSLNHTFQKLIAEQARRDILNPSHCR